MTTENQEVNSAEAGTPGSDNGASNSPRPMQNRPPRPGPRGPRPDGEEGGNEGGGNEGGGNNRMSGGAPIRRPRRPGGKDRFAPRRRVDQFGVDGIREIDYKDFQRLRRYLSDRGKIEPRRKTGLSAYHQRSLTTAIKRARYMALLPYVANQSR